MAKIVAKSTSSPSLRNDKVAAKDSEPSLPFKGNGVQSLGRHGTLQTNAFQKKRKLEVFVECTDLVQLDSFSRSDPMCVMYVKRLGQWMEYGRTESIPNCLHPKVLDFSSFGKYSQLINRNFLVFNQMRLVIPFC